MQFKAIVLEDKAWINKYLKESAYQGCEFSFSTMMMWKGVYNTEVTDYMETMCYRCYVADEGKYIYAFPAGNGDKKAAIEGILALAKEQGQTFVISGFEKEWADWMEKQFPNQFEISTSRDDWDYVYSVEALSTLAGGKYHGKRNHIARFKDSDAWRYERLCAENIEECRAMSDAWYYAQIDAGNKSVLKEKPILNYALDHMEELELVGGVLYLGEKVVAFTVGEAMREDTFHVHIEKAYSNIQGAYPMINQQFVLHEMQDFTFVNREEDDGLPGLRRAKESYYPVKMIEKYTAVPK